VSWLAALRRLRLWRGGPTIEGSGTERHVTFKDGSVARVSIGPTTDNSTESLWEWSTADTALEILKKCPAIFGSGHVPDIEVVAFATSEDGPLIAWPFEVLSLDEYLKDAEKIDACASAVRFNADAPAGSFSIVWNRSEESSPGSTPHHVELTYRKRPDMMPQMLELTRNDVTRQTAQMLAEAEDALLSQLAS
jgi:hypothetical protein